ncbi:MAG: signal peptide peptidase SppA [Deltaproteobacteria bacterium]|nr:signal peptide peptidase SppA [Deltaproteobacteria bacterium]
MRAFPVLVAVAACANHPSPLDHAFDGKPKADALAADPWAAALGATKGSGGDDGEQGFDLQGMLTKIKDSIEKPGPYEALEKSKDFDETVVHWGVIELHGAIVERQAFSILGGHGGTELRELSQRLRALAKDDKIAGLLVRVGELEVSVPDIGELRAAMHDFRKAGKQLRCHTEAANNGTYMVLSACDSIALAPLGEIMITGPAAMPVHVKGLLDKLGVQADFIHVGAYKGAAEPLTRDAPSKEMEETLGAILDRRFQTMVETIATERKLDPGAVKALIDTALFPADQAKAAKLVDEVATWESVLGGVGKPWTKIELEPDQKDQLAAMLKVARFIGAMPPERPLGDHVAVVYALGNIVDGKGSGVIGAREEIASRTMVAALRALAADDNVKAVVLRIDSGGGSAQASELIWNAVAELKAKKPVIVSMSDVAASGGYYIASGATKIYALDDTLTGSIGVVGGRIAPAAALAKLGVNTFPMGRGKRATMLASLSPWTDEERALMQSNMETVYKVFVGRVAEGRHKKPDEVQPIAQGRVWTGAKAKELGLVDEIGGLDAAVADAQKLAKVDPAVDLEIYPPTPTLRDVLSGWGEGVHASFGLDTSFAASLGAELAALDPRVAREALRLLALVESFQTTHVQTVAILPALP